MKPKALSVSLTSDQERFVRTQIESGRYHTAEEMVREGLRLLEERDRQSSEALESVRRKIAVGLDQAKRGELHDGETFFAELERQLNQG